MYMYIYTYIYIYIRVEHCVFLLFFPPLRENPLPKKKKSR